MQLKFKFSVFFIFGVETTFLMFDLWSKNTILRNNAPKHYTFTYLAKVCKTHTLHLSSMETINNLQPDKIIRCMTFAYKTAVRALFLVRNILVYYLVVAKAVNKMHYEPG